MFARTSRIVLPPLIMVVVLIAFRVAVGLVAREDFVAVRNEPWTIAPRYDRPRVVTDQQLFAVLDRVKPPAGPLSTNKLIHALRLWGADARFDDQEIPSGAAMRDYFLNDGQFRRRAGSDAPPLFTTTPRGIQVRAWEQDQPHRATASQHMDDLLATMAEIGTPLDTPLITRHGATTVGALMQTAMRQYHLDRDEYEWSLISYARYMFPVRQWKNEYGQSIGVNALVEELIDHPLTRGKCNGIHRLEAMVVLYRADEQAQALSPRLRRRMLAHMAGISALLTAAQSEEGYWTRRWPRGTASRDDTSASLVDRLLVTGHHLEWLALAPPQVQPPRETVVRAAQWLVRAMLEIDEATLQRRYGPLSHAARALCLWRSQDPYQAWKKGRAGMVNEVSMTNEEARMKNQ